MELPIVPPPPACSPKNNLNGLKVDHPLSRKEISSLKNSNLHDLEEI